MMKFNLFGRGLRLQIAVTIACQLAFILFGYDQGVFSGIVTNEDWLKTFNHPNTAVEGIIVSSYDLGAFFGCIVAFFFAEKCGRRLCMWIAMGWIIVGATLQCTSFSTAQILVARFVTGIGTGIETSTVPMYQSELCDADKRGRLVSSEPLFVGVGIVISYFFDYGMSFVGGPVAWRVPIACQTIFAFVVIFLVFGLPESPRWLFYHDRPDEAVKVLCDVWDADEDDPRVVKMKEEVLGAIQLEKAHGEYKWRQLFKRDDVQTGRRVLLAYGMQFMNQVGGINLVVYFIPTALQSNVGLPHNTALLIGGAVQCMFFVGSLVPTFFLDKLGRRRPMMWGSLGLAISMMMISILLSFKYKPDQFSVETGKTTASAAVAFFFTYMLIFGASANCIPWVYVPEILPLHARAKGTAIGISSNWLWNFFVVMITPTIIQHLKWKAYLIFMCTNLAFIPLVYFFYPETSNLTLEEIDYLFTKEGNKGPSKLLARSQPVLESLKPASEVEKDLERDGGLTGAAEHIETKDGEKSSQEDMRDL